MSVATSAKNSSPEICFKAQNRLYSSFNEIAYEGEGIIFEAHYLKKWIQGGGRLLNP